MAERGLLAYSSIDEFVAWAATQGYERVAVKGHYEVLRLLKKGWPPLLYFRTDKAETEHATCQNDSRHLVRRWIRERDKEVS